MDVFYVCYKCNNKFSVLQYTFVCYFWNVHLEMYTFVFGMFVTLQDLIGIYAYID